MTCPVCANPVTPEMRFCSMCGAPLSGGPLSRERRRVTVVFIDLAGFTTMTTGFDPEELRDFADEILTVVAGVIEDYDGYVDAFQGDGLIALFGAPRSHPDDPQRAVQAAAAGLRAIEAIGRSKGHRLLGRAGVNTGVVIAGSVGLGRVRDYTVMGSAVNLAARLESAASPGEVWVGPETFEATRHLLRYTPSPPLQLNGFPDVTQAYRLQSGEPERSSDPYAQLRFVGRRLELAALHRALEDASRDARLRLVWLVGEAGSGKTRLLREFVSQQGGALWLERQTQQGGPWYGWAELAAQLFGTGPGDDPPARRQKVLAGLQALEPTSALAELSPARRQSWRAAVLSSLALAPDDANGAGGGISQTGPMARQASEGAEPAAGIEAWARLLDAVAESRAAPLLLVADQGPHDATLDALLSGLQTRPLAGLVLRSSRGRDLPPRSETVALRPLSREESLELLVQVANPVTEVATRSLLGQVGGVPAYILELGRALGSGAGLQVSGSLTSLLQARLDMLPAGARQMLVHAAITGERSWKGLLAQLGSDDDSLQALLDENLLVQESAASIPGELELRFQSELLRDAILRMIPKSDQPALHARIAAWLEQQAPLTLAPLTGHHFEHAGAAESAYGHYLAAAEAAALQGDYPRARDLFERLTRLELEPELRAQGRLAYAQAALQHGDRAEARRQLAAAAGWLDRCRSGERCRELRAVYEGLLNEAGLESQDQRSTIDNQDG